MAPWLIGMMARSLLRPSATSTPLGARLGRRAASVATAPHAPHAHPIGGPPCERYARAREHLAHGFASPLCEVEVSHGLGSWVWTREGNKLLDFTAGIGVLNLGHCHPVVVAAAQRQLGRLFHTSVASALSEPLIELTERMVGSAGVLPAGLDRVMFSTTGAEAVENALRIARAATRRPNVIVFQGG